jgi:hypothetical protein
MFFFNNQGINTCHRSILSPELKFKKRRRLSPLTLNMAHIPFFYRILPLYIEPLAFLVGIRVCFFDPHTFIKNFVPSAVSSLFSNTDSLPPATEHLIRFLGCVYLLGFVMRALLLWQFQDGPNGINVQIWRIVMFSDLLTDFVYTCCVYLVDPVGFCTAWDVKGWESRDWTSTGISGMVIAMRIAFLLGIGGVGRKRTAGRHRHTLPHATRQLTLVIIHSPLPAQPEQGRTQRVRSRNNTTGPIRI